MRKINLNLDQVQNILLPTHITDEKFWYTEKKQGRYSSTWKRPASFLKGGSSVSWLVLVAVFTAKGYVSTLCFQHYFYVYEFGKTYIRIQMCTDFLFFSLSRSIFLFYIFKFSCLFLVVTKCIRCRGLSSSFVLYTTQSTLYTKHTIK